MLSRFAQIMLITVLASAPYAAIAQMFEATGTVVDLGDGPGSLTLGTSCSVSFDFDPNASVGFSNSTFSSYTNALMNVSVTLGTGESLTIPNADVSSLSGSTDFWDGFLDPFAGTTDIAGFTHATFGMMEFASVQVELTHASGTAFQQSPPELLPPTEPPFDGRAMRFGWNGQFEDSISVGCSIGPLAAPGAVQVPLMSQRTALITTLLLGLTLLAGIRRARS